MALAMTRPRKHPRTGISEFCKHVPDRLRPLIGKREVKCSLKGIVNLTAWNRSAFLGRSTRGS